MSFEQLKPEVILAAVIAIAATVWKGISMFFKMRNDIVANSTRISSLEKDLYDRLHDIKEDLKEQKEDLQRHAATTEVRHSSMDKKLDRIIERGITGKREHDL